MWWKNTRIMALSIVVCVVSLQFIKKAYPRAASLISTLGVFALLRFIAPLVSLIGTILRLGA